MDLETENRIAAILMKEAAELRRQAAEEGALGYLRKPSVRNRPNSRFLTATVLGVQQSNKAVEVSEMWRIRQKEQDLNNRLRTVDDDDRRRLDKGTSHSWSRYDGHDSVYDDTRHPSSSRGPVHKNNSHTRDEPGDEGFRDEEMEEFLHSRVKRGRGAVGSRMDEAGPYLLSSLKNDDNHRSSPEASRPSVMYGPEKPSKRTRSETSSRDLRKDEKDRTNSKKHKSDRKSKSKKSKDKKRRKD